MTTAASSAAVALVPKFESVTADVDGKGALEVKVHASGVKRFVKYHLTGKATTLYTNVLASSITSAAINYISKEISYGIDSVLSTSSSTKHLVSGVLRATLPGVTIGNPRNLALVKYDDLVVKDETNGIEFALAPVEKDFRAIVAAPVVAVATPDPAVKEVKEAKEISVAPVVTSVEETKEAKETKEVVAVEVEAVPKATVEISSASAVVEEKTAAPVVARVPLVKALHNTIARPPVAHQMAKPAGIKMPVVTSSPMLASYNAAITAAIERANGVRSSLQKPPRTTASLDDFGVSMQSTAGHDAAAVLKRSLMSNMSVLSASTAVTAAKPIPRPIAQPIARPIYQPIAQPVRRLITPAVAPATPAAPSAPSAPAAPAAPAVVVTPAPAPAPAPAAVAVELAGPKIDEKDRSIAIELGDIAGIDRIVLKVGSK